MQVIVRPNGDIEFIHNETLAAELADLGPATKQRASHVEPVRWLPRLLFHCIRRLVSDESRAAGWTRRWPVVWRARILNGGPTLGPFTDRAKAIEAEVSWLEQNRIGCVDSAG